MTVRLTNVIRKNIMKKAIRATFDPQFVEINGRLRELINELAQATADVKQQELVRAAIKTGIPKTYFSWATRAEVAVGVYFDNNRDARLTSNVTALRYVLSRVYNKSETYENSCPVTDNLSSVDVPFAVTSDHSVKLLIKDDEPADRLLKIMQSFAEVMKAVDEAELQITAVLGSVTTVEKLAELSSTLASFAPQAPAKKLPVPVELLNNVNKLLNTRTITQ